MSILSFLSINGTEITEHNRLFNNTQYQQLADVETSSGKTKRFYKKHKKVVKLNFSYLPSDANKTVDGRAGRDFLKNLAYTSPLVLVSYIDKPGTEQVTFYGFINSYSESLVRRDLSTQCSYWDVSFDLEEK
jgi:hypothetical protein